MKLSWAYLGAIAAAIFIVVIAWFSGPLLHLAGMNRLVLAGGIILTGAVAIAGFLLWAHSKQARGAAGEGKAAGAASGGAGANAEEIHLLIREAAAKVSSARLGRGAKLGELRVFFVLGPSGAGKTTAVLHSGLDPELLAGQVFHESAVIPTATANFWFARKSVFAEVGTQVAAEPRTWARLVQRLSKQGLWSLLGRKAAAERAAIVCVDCEKLAQPASAEGVAGAARTLRARLSEMARVLGSSFPVYVLFTHADRVAFFDDFVRTMTNEEVTQVFGVTLPVSSSSDTSVYAERETGRLTTAFNALFFSAADCRPGLLSREGDTEKQPGVYEFPRAFRKLNKPTVQFLVELCRPSQLQTGPFLRGFYFTGMRTVAASASTPTMMATKTMILGATSVSAPAGNATTILRPEDLPGAGQAQAWQTGTQIQGGEPQKTTQPVFLSHIFSDILLQDRAALGASGVSTRVNLWRRVLLAAAAVIAFVWICGSTAAYFSNRALESSVLRASQDARVSDSSPTQAATLESLRQLETLRQSLDQLNQYERGGAPLHLRWGLYAGHDLYPDAQRIYFSRFRQLLFGQIQNAMLDTLRRLPDTPGPNDEYALVYDTLKAYLITTSNPDKSTADFLTPVLTKYWAAGQDAGAEMQILARQQFNFYADELRFENPYSPDADTQTRDHARDYLNHFGAVPRIYAAMQNAAARQSRSVNFYRDHPDAADVIRSAPEVPGVFTTAGWNFMQDAITHSDQYFRGEEWVLGSGTQAISNRADLETQLRAMYQSDYIRQWRDFLKDAKVAPYNGIEDAARKLTKLSGNESPVLALLCSASMNTAGRSADVDKAFAPVQQVVPATCESKYITPLTVPYVAGLANLQSCLEMLRSAPAEQKDAQQQQCAMASSAAKLVVAQQIVPVMSPDPDGHIDDAVRTLLEQPIALPSPPAPTGSGAKGLCDSFAQIASKYPFNPANEAQEASLQEFGDFFRPLDGTLARFMKANENVLALQGSQISLKPGAKADWAPTFLSFLNRARFIQQSAFLAGSVQPQYRFTVRATLAEGGVTGVSFAFDGQMLKYPGSAPSAVFVWPGSGAQEARISYQTGGGQETDLLSARGPWAILKLLSVPDARVSSSGGVLSAEWHPLQADRRTPLTLSGSGRPIVVHLDFDGGGVPFVLQGGYFSSLSCRANR